MTSQLRTFPDLEPIELRHLPDIRAISAKFPSYSDFNPVSLWTWSASGPYRVGQLNGNLVVEFSDYLTGEAFLSFIGDSEVPATAMTLIEHAQTRDDLTNDLRLVPEFCVTDLIDDRRFSVADQPDERDYLLSTAELARHSGKAHAYFRRGLSRFERECVESGAIDIVNVDIERLAFDSGVLLAIFDRWRTGSTDGTSFSASERLAMERLSHSMEDVATHAEVYLRLAVRGGDIFGFSFFEVLSDNTAVGHFWKSDGRIPGLTARFILDQAEFLNSRHIGSINFEQDLGIPGLRWHKQRLRPFSYLNKFTVGLVH